MLPKIIAHRGASADAPENTMAAFRLAIVQHAEGIELDIQMSKDGKLVVIHDENLQRTTDRKGAVAELNYEEIRRADASNGFARYRGEPVPLLEEVMELIAPTELMLNIELKNGIIRYEGMEQKVVQMVREFGMERRVVYSSFNHYSMIETAKLAPQTESALLYASGLYEPWKYALQIGAGGLHPQFLSIDKEIVRRSQEAGIKVRPYTVNKEKDMRTMISYGVDAVITNYPLRMKRILSEI